MICIWLVTVSAQTEDFNEDPLLESRDLATKYFSTLWEIPQVPRFVPPENAEIAAEVWVRYAIESDDWDVSKQNLTQHIASVLWNIPVDHMNITDETWLWLNHTCDDPPAEGNVPVANTPVMEEPEEPATKPGKDVPSYSTIDEFLDVLWDANFCVCEYNASLQYNGIIVNNTWITGERDENNEWIYADSEKNIDLEIHVNGREWLQFVEIFNIRFVMNDSIPIPCINNTEWDDLYFDNITIPNSTVLCNETRWTPEELRPWYLDENDTFIVDPATIDPHDSLTFLEWPEDHQLYQTEELAFRSAIIGWKVFPNASQFVPETLGTRIPICREPPMKLKGCFEFTFHLYEHDMLSDYKMNYRFHMRKLSMQRDMNSRVLRFTCSDAPFNPTYVWLLPPPPPSRGPWTGFEFPQTEWVNQEDCKVGEECPPISIAPSARYMHSAVIYKSWNFEEDALPTLCARVGHELTCGQDCLTNLTCLGGQDAYFSDTTVRGNFYYRSEFFATDDHGTDPMLELGHKDCPSACCGNRRLCMRSADVMGYNAPFDRSMMLVFGGRAYKHDRMGDGRLIYHNCEHLSYEEFAAKKAWRSCTEEVVGELWRYDLVLGQWHFIKPDTSRSVTSNQLVGIPSRRFGHAASLIVVDAESDANGVRRQFMYMFGGMGPQCENGLCSDFWRYEIPWAAQSYYPHLVTGEEWNRANRWFLLNDPNHLCPGSCGRYRHSMASSADNDFIYVFGGEGKGEHFNDLFRYRVMTNMWEKIKVFGLVKLTRLTYNTFGKPLIVDLPLEKFDPNIDYVEPRPDCPTCGAQYGHISTFPDVQIPLPRADTALTFFGNLSTLFIFGGYRTTWGTADGYAASGPTDVVFDFNNVDPVKTQGQYYMDDQWLYIHETSHWMPLRFSGSAPTWRRGHKMATRQKSTGKSQVFLYGGRYQDEPMNDLWVLDIDNEEADRKWSRIDRTYAGQRPPPTMYHSFIYNKDLDKFILMGGLNWERTDLSFSDKRRDLDRRCVKNAKDLVTAVFDDTLLEEEDPLKDLTALIKFGGDKLEMLKEQIVTYICTEPPPCGILREIETVEKLRSESPTLTVANLDTLLWNFKVIVQQCVKECAKQSDVMCNSAMHKMDQNQGPQHFLDSLRHECDVYDRCCKVIDEVEDELSAYFTELESMTPDTPNTIKASLVNRTKFWFAEPLILHDIFNVRAIVRSQQWKCELTKFISEFKPINAPGVWIFDPNTCPTNHLGVCSGRGQCVLSHCVCFTGWTGRMCQQKVCPGSLCYVHSGTHEQHCVECSQRGRCVDGKCHCHEGYILDDCGAIGCKHNCSSTTVLQRGVCIEEFPVHQCHCFDRYAGLYCEKILCLNECSDHGICVEGNCICNPMYFGHDCSLFVFKAGATSYSLVMVLLMFL